MMHRLLTASLAFVAVCLASCHPTISVSPATEGTVWTEAGLRGEPEGGRSLSPQQIQLLATWINARKDGWDCDPFVTYVPCVHVVLKEPGRRSLNASICPGRLAIGADTQYTRPISHVEYQELLEAIGIEAR